MSRDLSGAARTLDIPRAIMTTDTDDKSNRKIIRIVITSPREGLPSVPVSSYRRAALFKHWHRPISVDVQG